MSPGVKSYLLRRILGGCQNQILEILRREMIRDYRRFGSEVGEALIERRKVRARLVVFVRCGSAIQYAPVNMGVILQNRHLLFRQG
jgi:hypothetical protein